MMKKYVVIILSLFIINSCQKDMLPNQYIQEEGIKTLTEQLIYGKEEEVRIKALDDLTGMGIKVRYSAINEFINAAESNPDLFPKENYEKNQSLLREIITARLKDNETKNKKECIEERMLHLRMLNRLLKLSMQYKVYYEMAKILHQKYLYGTLWSQESRNIYKDKSAAIEFDHAKNAAVANLHLLLKVAKDERTKNFVRERLGEIDEM
jgi:hypothetical protein